MTASDLTVEPAPRAPTLAGSVFAAMMVHTLLSAGTHLVAKSATETVDPVLLVTLRLLLAGVVFGVILWRMPAPRLPPRALWLRVLAFGFIAGPVNQGLFLWGVHHSHATHAGLLYALTPVGVMLASGLLGREHWRGRALGGSALAFGGVLVLLLGRGLDAASGSIVGDVAMLGAVAAWVAWTIESRDLGPKYGGTRVAAWAMLSGALWAALAAPWTISSEGIAGISGAAWGGIGYLVLITSVVSYLLWNFALMRTEASRVAVFTNLQPVVTALLAYPILAEPLGWETAVGGVCVIGGVGLVNARARG